MLTAAMAACPQDEDSRRVSVAGRKGEKEAEWEQGYSLVIPRRNSR